MNYEIHQPLKHELWRSLPIKDLLSLCRTNREFNDICRQNSTWVYLIQRDFGASYNGPNAYLAYRKYREILTYFSSVYPIITSLALEMIYNYVPNYDLLIARLEKAHGDYPAERDIYILNFNMVHRAIINRLKGDEFIKLYNYYMDYRHRLISDKDAILNKLHTLDLNQGVNYLISLAKGKYLVFVNTKPTIIETNLDELELIGDILTFQLSGETVMRLIGYYNNIKNRLMFG